MMEESCSSKGQATSSPSPPPPPLRGTRSGAWPVIVLLLVVFASVCDAAVTDSVRDADQAQAGYLDNHNMDPAIVQGATFGEYGGYAFFLAKGVSPLCLFFFFFFLKLLKKLAVAVAGCRSAMAGQDWRRDQWHERAVCQLFPSILLSIAVVPLECC